MVTERELKEYQRRELDKLEEYLRNPARITYCVGDFIYKVLSSCDLSTPIEKALDCINEALPQKISINKEGKIARPTN